MRRASSYFASASATRASARRRPAYLPSDPARLLGDVGPGGGHSVDGFLEDALNVPGGWRFPGHGSGTSLPIAGLSPSR